MLNNNFLKDDFELHGTDLNEFREVVSEIAQNTHFERVNSAEIHIHSFRSTRFNEELNHEELTFFPLNPDNLPTANPDLPIGHKISYYDVQKYNLDYITKEITNETKVLLTICDSPYFISGNTFSRLHCFGLSGGFLSEPSLERDILIAKQFKKEKKVTLVTKYFEDKKKVFAILSENYTEIPQMQTFALIDKLIHDGTMGEIRCSGWFINHDLTAIDIEFPDKAKEIAKSYGLPEDYVPGIRITTSDTGLCSFRVRGTWRIHNSVSLFGEVSRRHSGDIDITKIFDEVEKNIFAEYVKIPERLCDLMMMDITPNTLDLSEVKDRKKNKDIIEGVFKSTFAELGIVKAIGKKNEIVLRTLMLEEIDPSISYTAYDIAIQLLTLPERTEGLTRVAAENLAKAVAGAPFCDYETESSLYLC